MAERDALSAVPREVRGILADYLAGRRSTPITVLNLLMRGGGPEVAEAAVASLPQHTPTMRRRVREIGSFIDRHRDACAAVVDIVARDANAAIGSPSADATVDIYRRMFDELARQHPEKGVALYSFGDPGLLRRASDEIVERLSGWGLLRAEARLLEIGCGIGRLLPLLAPRVREVVALDVSPGMIAEARRRCAGIPNLRLDVCSGRDLRELPDAAFDILLAVDVFPYFYRAGENLLPTQMAEATRVLRPGGDLVILNLSYRGDLAADREDIARLAAQHGFEVQRNGEAAFRLWDGLAFHLRREACDRPRAAREERATPPVASRRAAPPSPNRRS